MENTPRVADNAPAHRFEIFVGDELAGFAEYESGDHALSLTHTVIDPAFEGQGLGSALARSALDAARDAGLGVLPVCPFIRTYIERHPAYLDLVAADQRARFGLATP